jgi:hypothetical protein
LTNGLLPSFLVCESCGGDTNNGGKCSTGDNAGSICCPSGANLACTNPRCNADGGQCTGDLNGCLCLLNGRKRGSRRRS